MQDLFRLLLCIALCLCDLRIRAAADRVHKLRKLLICVHFNQSL